MILFIDTSDQAKVIIALKQGQVVLAQKKFLAPKRQAEKLLPAINLLLRGMKKKLTDLKGIEVADSGSSFTALRIGVLTANALGFALNIPVKAASQAKTLSRNKIKVVAPKYDKMPNIG